MSNYLYLLLTPEALVASMLPPEEFGAYLAVGTEKRAHGQAVFFKVEDLPNKIFNLADMEKRCIPHPNGEPKHSVYLSIYRVLERVPVNSLKNLYLTTPDGKVLELRQSKDLPEHTHKYNLYQELAPVTSRVVSGLKPVDLIHYITDKEHNLFVPRICFVDLRLGELAENPAEGIVGDLPYRNVEHLRDCIIQIQKNPEKSTKTVNRVNPQWFPYRAVATGIYAGDRENTCYYPFPSEKELQTKYYDWWRSASIMGDSFGTLF
ncbi:MAG: hypothetical protein GXP33_08090 [Spirochaetes bacterium]|nr:hypothetical protein [Spirochaetota bacterium]